MDNKKFVEERFEAILNGIMEQGAQKIVNEMSKKYYDDPLACRMLKATPIIAKKHNLDTMTVLTIMLEFSAIIQKEE